MDWESAYILDEMRRWFSSWGWKEALDILERVPAKSATPIGTSGSPAQNGSILGASYSVLQCPPQLIFTAIDWNGKVDKRLCSRNFDKEKFLWDLERVLEGRIDAVALLNLLEKHGTAVGVAIQGFEGCVSLYDIIKHRLTLESCRRWSMEASCPYLLVSGDLSGIQSFIYTIHPDGALRTLRARSFFVELIIEHFVAQILSYYSLGRYHVVYSAGGGFYLLIPNRSDLISDIEKFADRLNAWLLRTQGGRLFLALGSIALNDEHLADAATIWGKLAEKTGRKKGQRYLRELKYAAESDLDPLRVRQPGDESCAVCQRDDVPLIRDNDEDALYLCEFCKTMMEWGRLLPRAAGIEVWKCRPSDGVTLEIDGVFYRLVTKEDLRDQKRESQIQEYWMFDTGEVRLGARHVLNRPGYAVFDRNGRALTFEELAKRAIGAKLLGVLRMDVDHLGRIFSRGLPPSQRDLIHLSILSRELSAFFKRELFKLCQEEAAQGRGNFHVVYAGGDDLFMIGTWSDLAPFTLKIQKSFSEYTAHNPGVTISGGFIVETYHTPLYRLAELAGEAEDISKESGRNRMTMFYTQREPHYAKEGEGHPFNIAHTWDTLRAAYEDLVVPLRDLRISQTFFQFSLSFVDLLERGRAHFPQYLYYLARVHVEDEAQAVWADEKSKLANPLDLQVSHFEAWKTVFAWLKLYRREEE